MSDSLTEKDLDIALERAFQRSSAFAAWFLSRTKFGNTEASYHWSRSDHPWGRIPTGLADPDAGIARYEEGETDVLVVFRAAAGDIFALHIENKLANSKFEPDQPEKYERRAKHWLGNPKYGSYSDYQTVLVSPAVFRQRNQDGAEKFGGYVAYEEIANHIPLFKSYLSNAT